MFFLTYLGRELRRRMKQSVVIALGLALGVGLVITVAAASSGVKKAQSDVLSALYGVGTDITVTHKPSPPKNGGGKTSISIGAPSGHSGGLGAEECVNGKCHQLKGGTITSLISTSYGTMAADSVASIARLHDVASAAGGLLLTATRATIPSAAHPNASPPTTFSVDGVDLGHPGLGPFSTGTLHSGRTFRDADADANVAVVDSNYAIANKLRTGSKISVNGTKFTVIGVVRQPQGSGAPDVYIPLARAQHLATEGPGSSTTLKGKVNTVYVSAASAADIATVRQEIARLLPSATVTTAASLASQVTGSVSSAAKLASDLGRWLSVLVLIAAFAVASLMTVAAVTRRVREFGTLKALGWRGRRVIAQVLGESVTTGILGAAAGVGLGFAAAAVITRIGPTLTAKVGESTGQHFFNGAGPGSSSGEVTSGGPANLGSSPFHTVTVPLVAHVGSAAIIAAVLLAIAGGLLAGALGSWRIGRLRPAVALATVE
ncbi:MAG TPA: ABC transporter permease [Streptosporangiaceae bacterium]|jgi:putative ABC transport system permease protein